MSYTWSCPKCNSDKVDKEIVKEGYYTYKEYTQCPYIIYNCICKKCGNKYTYREEWGQ